MSLLSLGLLKHEREDVARENAAESEDSAEREGAVSNPASADCSSVHEGSVNRPIRSQAAVENGGGRRRGVQAAVLSSFDRVATDETAGEGTRQYVSSGDADLSDKNVRPTRAEPTSQLPEVIEELRQKFSGKDLPGAVIWDQRKGKSPTEYLTVADRKGVPTFGTFRSGYVPSRGLLYSIIVHEVGMFLFFLLFTYGLGTPRAQKLRANSTIQDHVIYLPEVGGGTEGQTSPGGGVSAPQQPSAAPARASKGFAYPGTQAILSDPPNPTNAFQTVMRPLIVHPRPIEKLIPLPNIVQMGETRLPNDLIAPKPAMPRHQLAPPPIKV